MRRDAREGCHLAVCPRRRSSRAACSSCARRRELLRRGPGHGVGALLGCAWAGKEDAAPDSRSRPQERPRCQPPANLFKACHPSSSSRSVCVRAPWRVGMAGAAEGARALRFRRQRLAKNSASELAARSAGRLGCNVCIAATISQHEHRRFRVLLCASCYRRWTTRRRPCKPLPHAAPARGVVRAVEQATWFDFSFRLPHQRQWRGGRHVLADGRCCFAVVTLA